MTTIGRHREKILRDTLRELSKRSLGGSAGNATSSLRSMGTAEGANGADMADSKRSIVSDLGGEDQSEQNVRSCAGGLPKISPVAFRDEGFSHDRFPRPKEEVDARGMDNIELAKTALECFTGALLREDERATTADGAAVGSNASQRAAADSSSVGASARTARSAVEDIDVDPAKIAALTGPKRTLFDIFRWSLRVNVDEAEKVRERQQRNIQRMVRRRSEEEGNMNREARRQGKRPTTKRSTVNDFMEEEGCSTPDLEESVVSELMSTEDEKEGEELAAQQTISNDRHNQAPSTVLEEVSSLLKVGDEVVGTKSPAGEASASVEESLLMKPVEKNTADNEFNDTILPLSLQWMMTTAFANKRSSNTRVSDRKITEPVRTVVSISDNQALPSSPVENEVDDDLESKVSMISLRGMIASSFALPITSSDESQTTPSHDQHYSAKASSFSAPSNRSDSEFTRRAEQDILLLKGLFGIEENDDGEAISKIPESAIDTGGKRGAEQVDEVSLDGIGSTVAIPNDDNVAKLMDSLKRINGLYSMSLDLTGVDERSIIRNSTAARETERRNAESRFLSSMHDSAEVLIADLNRIGDIHYADED